MIQPGPAGDGERPFPAVLEGIYDTVTSAIVPYHDAAASQVAGQLDAEVLGLLREATGLQAPAAP